MAGTSPYALRTVSDIDERPASWRSPAPGWPVWPWLGLLVLIGVDAVWLALTRFSLEPHDLFRLVVIAVASGVMMAVARRVAANERLAMLFSGTALTLLAWPALRLLNHLTMSLPLPLADAHLAAIDAALGLDWLSYVRWVDHHPGLLNLMGLTYRGLTGYSSAAFLLLLVVRGTDRAREFVLLFLAAAIASIVVGMWLPALGAMAHVAPPASTFTTITPSIGTYAVASMEALRSGTPLVFHLDRLPGLVCLPSFHTAMGVILIYCSRGGPRLFLPALAINLVMISGTPVLGAHYFIDIIAGAAMALALITALRRGAIPSAPGR